MIAREIGECRSGNSQPIEAVLIQPVARRFYRQIIDAVIFQTREFRMQPHRVGRRMTKADMAKRRIDADRAKARGFTTLRSPNLTHEGRHRGFAVRAGDRRNGGWLELIKICSESR